MDALNPLHPLSEIDLDKLIYFANLEGYFAQRFFDENSICDVGDLLGYLEDTSEASILCRCYEAGIKILLHNQKMEKTA